MRIVMRQTHVWQDAGGECVLDVGQAYDLPETVAQAFLASGAAEEEVADRRVRELGPMRAPETKPMGVPERKRS